MYPSIPTSSFGLNQAKVHNLALSYIPPMYSQVRRTMAVVATPDVLDQFVNNVVATKSRRYSRIPYDQMNPLSEYSPKDLVTTCNGLVGFSPQVETNAVIPAGWESPRYSFDMVVEYEKFAQGDREMVRITGYTDLLHMASYGGFEGNKPPEMKFHVDHITVIPKRTDMPQVHESVITTSIATGSSGYTPTYRTAVGNIFGGLNQKAATEQYGVDGDTMITDMDALCVSPTPGVGDNLTTLSPTQFASSVLNGIAHESKNMQNEHSYNVYNDAGTEFSGDAFSRNVLLSRLSDLSKTYVKGVFTLEGLCRLDPNAAEFVKHVTTDINQEHTLSHNEWGGSSQEEMAAWQLVQTVLSCAYRNGIGSAEFAASNWGTGDLNQHILTYADIRGINNGISIALLTESQMASFETQVKTEALSQASQFGSLVYQLKCQFDVTRISQVEISIEGLPPKSYMFPMFASSCTSPFITTSGLAYTSLVNGLYDIGEAIFDNKAKLDPIVNPINIQRGGFLGQPSQITHGQNLTQWANNQMVAPNTQNPINWSQGVDSRKDGLPPPPEFRTSGYTPFPGQHQFNNQLGTNLNSGTNSTNSNRGF